MMTIRIVIMAKSPRPGFAKTRLIPALGADGAARLARVMLDHTLLQAREANIGPIELCITPSADPLWSTIAVPPATAVTDQGSGDLGDRLARASERALDQNRAVLLMGTDCPALDAARLLQIKQELLEHDAVILPAMDGGYAALAIKQFSSTLFTEIAWSTASVASTTLARLRELGWTVSVLPKVSDIDEPCDLEFLPNPWLAELNLQAVG